MVSEDSVALKSESNKLCKVHKLVKRCIVALAQIKEEHGEEHTKRAEESCAVGVRREVDVTLHSNHDRFDQSQINNLDARLTAIPD